MKTWNRSLQSGFAALVFAAFAVVLLLPVASRAGTTTLLSQNFSGAQFPPSGWSASSVAAGNQTSQGASSVAWYRSSAGNGGTGGSYGSAVANGMPAYSYYCYDPNCTGSMGYALCPITLTAPTVSLSGFPTGDTQFVDFDAFIPINAYQTGNNTNLGSHFSVMNGTTLLTDFTVTKTSDGTTGNTGITSPSDPANWTASTYWRHFHVAIPVGTASIKLVFKYDEVYTACYYTYWYADNIAITNVTITNVHHTFLTMNGPATLNFGQVPYLVPAGPLYSTFTNPGPGPVTFSNWAISGQNPGDYTITRPPPASLAAGATDSVGVLFTPQGPGVRTGTLTFNTSADLPPVASISLTGFGMQPSIGLPAGLIALFSRVRVAFGATAYATLMVTNTGTVPLHVSNASFISGDQPYASFYHVTRVPPAILPGMSDSMVLSFTPYVEGRMSATLNVVSDASNGTQLVPLVAVGIIPHLVITQSRGSGTTLSFDSVAIGDSVCQSLMLHNIGSDTLKLLRQIVTYGDYDFSFYPLTGSSVNLAPDASAIVNVCFKPLARGGRLASIRFYTNIPLNYPDNRDTSQFLINVTGTGVPYGIMSVVGNPSDSALIDSTKCANATIKNMGLSELTVTSTTITGAGASDFTISGVTMPFTLAPGASVPVTLCFKAATRGPEAVTLTVNGTTSGRPLTQSIPLLGVGLTACLDAAPSPITFGSTALAGKTLAKTGHDTTCVTVTNCGDVPVTYTAAFTPGTNGGYHVLGSLMTPVVAPNGTTTICIEFDADTIGLAGGSVVVSASERAAAPKTLALAGVGAGVVIAGAGNGGILGLNYCDTITVTINNTGNVDWTPGSSIGTTGTNAGDFTPIGTTNPATIPAGGSGTIKVIFCPTTNGLAETADLTFPNAAPTPLSGTVTLNGLGSSGVTQQTEKDGFTLGATYPNPTNGKADVIVTLPRASRVTMVLTNLAGAVVRTVYTGTLQNGDNVVSLDASTLPSGTYFYTLTSGDVRLTREMIVGR